MKRKVSFGIAVLMILVACLFVSCNSEVSTTAQVNDGKLVYATFDKMSKAIRPSSSSMTISYELDNIDDLYWVYTATKTDGAGTTGQTTGTRVPGNEQHKGLGGAIGPFSKGTWTFTVEGYKYTGASTEIMDPSVETLRESTDFNLIYVGTAGGVVFKVTNDAENPETIDITVYLQTEGGKGTLKIAENSKFFWAATGEGGYALTDLKLKVYDGETLKDTIDLTGHASEGTGHAVYYSNANDTNINNLDSGDHVFKVQIVRNVGGADQVFFEGTANAKIYAGITTVLDTQAIEGLFTYAQFNGTIDDSAVAEVVAEVVVATDHAEVAEEGNVSFETNYTPASGIQPSTDKTTVVIVSDVITAATYDLGVETSNIIAAGSKFSVESGSTAVASVDLTLTKTVGSTTTTVSDFGAGAATVTTYIAKNLTNVAVYYVGDEDALTDIDYDPTTGRLSFVTTHFSEFYVTSTDEAYNATQVKAYEKLDDAISDLQENDTVVLLKDIEVTDSYEIAEGKKLLIDFNGHTVTSSKVTSETGAAGFLLNNGTVILTDNSNSTVGGVVSANNNVIINNGTMTINKGVFKGNRVLTAEEKATVTRGVVHNSETGVMVINDIDLYVKQDYGVSNYGAITINGGKYASDAYSHDGLTYAYCVSTFGGGNMVINGGTVTGKHGSVSNSGGSMVINNVSATVDGGSGYTSFYALYLAGETAECVTIINGGTFNGYSNVAALIGNKSDGGLGLHSSVTINGGTYIGANDKQAINLSNMGEGYGAGDVSISGGTYKNTTPNDKANIVYGNKTLQDFLASGYTVTVTDNVYTVNAISN